MVLTSVKQSFVDAKNKHFNVLFYYFDIHGTIIERDYENGGEVVFYDYAKETLQLISKIPGIVMGLYTCSHPEQIERYQAIFKSFDINFKHVNRNPDVQDTFYGCFTDKPYFNALIDDKASFRPKEWKGLYVFFKLLTYKIEDLNLGKNNKDIVASMLYSINKNKTDKKAIKTLWISAEEYLHITEYPDNATPNQELMNNYNELEPMDEIKITDGSAMYILNKKDILES